MDKDELNAPEGEQQDKLTPDPNETVTDRSASVTETTAADEAAEQAEAERLAAEEAVAKAEAEAAAEAEGADKEPVKPKLDWKERRRIEEMNKRRAAEAERDRLQAELDAIRNNQPHDEVPATLTPEQAKAQARAELEAEARAANFRDATNRVLLAGQSNITDFENARLEMLQNFGDALHTRVDFFEALTELDPEDVAPDQIEAHRAQVFYALARDPEQTERLLSMPPLKMAMEVTKLSNKLAKPASPPPPKPISKVPAPVTPITGAPQNGGRLDDEAMPMDEWAKRYLKEMAGKGR